MSAAPAAAVSNPKRAEPPKDPPRLWRLDDKFYDLSDFIKEHPGGELELRQTMGTDITPLFHSHHMRGVPETLLAKYHVQNPKAEDVAAIWPCDYTFDKNGFFQVLKRRVNAMGLKNVRDVTPTYVQWSVAGVAGFIATWAACCYMPMGPSVVALALVNLTLRFYLTGIAHEAIHGRMRNWFTFELFDFFILFPSETWHLEHATQHHVHTKRAELDPDEILDPFRMCESVGWAPWHVLQAPLTVLMVFASLITFVDKHLICGVSRLKGTIYLFAFHLLPFITRPSWGEACLITGISVGLFCLITILSFHMSHINSSNAKHADFQPGGDWGAHQLLTSTNFKGAAWFFFGSTAMLEMQIEHHLFPVLSFANQLKIKPLIEQTAREFGLPYYEYRSVLHGIAGHMFEMHALSW